MRHVLYLHDGPPGSPPGIYLRLLLIGYFEGIDSQGPSDISTAHTFLDKEAKGGVFDAVPRVGLRQSGRHSATHTLQH